jgi:hypothetical protein
VLLCGRGRGGGGRPGGEGPEKRPGYEYGYQEQDERGKYQLLPVGGHQRGDLSRVVAVPVPAVPVIVVVSGCMSVRIMSVVWVMG